MDEPLEVSRWMSWDADKCACAGARTARAGYFTNDFSLLRNQPSKSPSGVGYVSIKTGYYILVVLAVLCISGRMRTANFSCGV